MVRRARLLVLTLLTVLAMVPAAVRADGDPASDVLLGENVFYPYSPPVSATLQKTLNAETAAAAKAHVPIKVALIASPVDLGVIPGLFGKPQAYAQFLDQEISFQKKQPLLVVMSTGYGVQGMSAAATRAAASLSKPAGARSDDLAQAAITAVGKLAAASGYPLASPAGKKSGGSSTTLIIVIALGVAAVLTAGALVALRRRQAAGR